MRLLSINSLMITTGIGCLALVATSSWAAAAPQADRGLETRPNRLDDQPQDLQRPGFQGPGGVPGPGDRQGPGGFPGPPGRGGPPGFGPGGPGQQAKIELVDRFDADANGFLDADERAEARQALETEGNNRQGPRRGPGGNRPTGSPGPRITPDDVVQYGDEPLYDTSVLRTLFLEFESDEWEQELEAFRYSDVDVPATVTVDGRRYEHVGVHFRGASSYFSVPAGLRRSLNVSFDLADEEQRLLGYKTLNLLNCNGDASMMSSILYSAIAREKIAAPQVNFVRVVINGESWGIYANAQQFDSIFSEENFGHRGARWKVSGSPMGDGGLAYLGEEEAPYRQRYEIKTKDKDASWESLIELCRVLNETPIDDLPTAIEPLLDVDEALWFLACDVVLANSDGYWTRASDYSILLDEEGQFHVIPHDMNEAFRGGGMGGPGGPGGPPPFGPGGPPPFGPGGPGPGGPGPGGLGPGGNPPGGPGGAPGVRPAGPDFPPQGPGGAQGPRGGQGPRGEDPRGGFGGPGEQGRPGGRGRRGFGGPGGEGGPDLDPLVGLDDERKPLRSRLLQVPEYRERYLHFVRLIAEQYLDWDWLGARVAAHRELIDATMKTDTRGLGSYEGFVNATRPDAAPAVDGGDNANPPRPPGGDPFGPQAGPMGPPGFGPGPGGRGGSLREFAEKRREYLLGLEVIRDVEPLDR